MSIILKIIKGVWRRIKKIISKACGFLTIRKTKRMKKKKNLYKVGFIVQLSAIWDKQIDIYEQLSQTPNIKTYLFVVPNYDFEHDRVLESYENNYFVKTYKEAIKVKDENNQFLDLKKYDLDYVFLPRPYDDYLPFQYRSKTVSKFCKCCYIPYGLTGSDNFDDTRAPFFDNIYCLFMDSDYQKELIKSRYRLSCAMGIKKIYSLGYPALSRFLDYPPINKIQTITWTPRWSVDPVIGGSNFLNYWSDFLNLIENKKFRFIFRPHPLMFDEMIKKGFIDEEFKNNFLHKLEQHNVLFDIDSPIEEIFKKTDLLITDFSTIISQFFMTNRPIIYCTAGIPLNKDYLEMMRFSYTANNWQEVLTHIQNIDGKGDAYSKNRINYIKENYSICRKSARLIADEIAKGI